MNKTYALVWNGAQRCWTAAGETARRRGKATGGKRAAVTAVSLLGFAALPAFALPTGETIMSGQADIVRTDGGRTMNINQHTDKLITNWQDFSVGGGERVNFHQPNSQSLALNRVIGTNGSRIDGQISANGRVFLVNPNGVLFGSGAQVNVGGLVASTQNLSDADFLAGNYRFSGSSTQAVTNDGTITAADGGSVALLGARVANNGTIQAKLGSVALAAGNAFTVNFDGSGLLNLQVDGGAVDAQASNGGLLKADGGEVLMTARAADNLLGAVVNNTGTIEARGLSSRGGKITLDGGTVNVGGKLDASTADAGAPAGAVTTRGERVKVANDAQVDTRAGNTAGTWTIEAANAGVNGANVNGQAIDADTLSRNLGTTNVALTNTKGDLTVGGPVAWTSDNALTLTSQKGNVDLNQTLSATGANASLALNAANRIRVNDAVTLTGRNAHLELNSTNGHTLANDKGVVTLSGDNASYSSNGEGYKVLHTLADLRNVDADLNGRYVLGNGIDGANAGFNSIGGSKTFNGTFDGLGNTVRRLTVSNPGNTRVGLFSANFGSIGNLKLDSLNVNSASTSPNAFMGGLVGINYGGRIHDVAATNMSVVHNGKGIAVIGGIVGVNYDGAIDNAHFRGRIDGTRDTISIGGIAGQNEGTRATIERSSASADIKIARTYRFPVYGQGAGMLVGRNTGTIANSSASGRIAAGEGLNVGGLVGMNDGGTLRNVSAVTTISAGEGSNVGGLVGRALGGSIEHASASGSIKTMHAAATGGLVGLNERGRIANASSEVEIDALGGGPVGGLVGRNDRGAIENVSAAGNVQAYVAAPVGGLVGHNTGTIENASASGNVTAGTRSNAGGLVGTNGGTIAQASASGNVTAGRESNAGGLVGLNDFNGAIRQSSSSGTVTADLSWVGGLVGTNVNVIENSQSSGSIDGVNSDLGGLVALNMGTIRSSQSSTRIGTGPLPVPILRGSLVALNFGSIESSTASGPSAGMQLVGDNWGTVDGKTGW
ncbi:GLUG motif-containing protein [Burkholderia lata]|uniref:Filamentous hemagglutinin-like protein n=1 Tax=Burkholderia lata (strain ATCC 17760 / DSM 23089 / LMG 22485 / NCIMB 9086 / R18194 / 383) TaxID=482957 RepID=Q390Z3_BURL3|nr:GLUG motif-containing protein [Burkholderia lata]ABB12973.1 Filamentous hemagglutinin-like protein [Burkholderia lata]